jgi:predicted dehydrogenase
MKALVVGLGSIGRRHIRCLRNIANAEIIALDIKPLSREDEFVNQFGIQQVENLSAAIAMSPAFAIIATPTAYHLETAQLLAEKGIPFFIEKPVSHSMTGLERLQKTIDEKHLSVLVGFQMRHHPGYQTIMQWISEGRIGEPLCCHGYVGQYLPDWRPGIDYRTNYSARPEMGGGVILDLCHQIDITLSIMGKAVSVSSMCNKISDLEIESEDVANILLEHQDNMGISHIHLNYLERTYEWYTRISGTEGTIIWDYGKGTAFFQRYDKSKIEYQVPKDYNRDVLYINQMQHWLNVVNGTNEPVVPFSQGVAVTAVAVAAKESSRRKRHVVL